MRGEGGGGSKLICLNHPRKIKRMRFKSWVGVMKRLPGSSLDVLARHNGTESNLRREAESLGIDGSRITEVISRRAYRQYFLFYMIGINRIPPTLSSSNHPPPIPSLHARMHAFLLEPFCPSHSKGHGVLHDNGDTWTPNPGLEF